MTDEQESNHIESAEEDINRKEQNVGIQYPRPITEEVQGWEDW